MTLPTVWEAQPPTQVAATQLVLLAEAQTALGITLAEVQQGQGDDTVRFLTAKGDAVLSVYAEAVTRDYYDAVVAIYPDAVETSNLGEAAIWGNAQRELMVYASGHLLSVTILTQSLGEDRALTAARQVAAAALPRL